MPEDLADAIAASLAAGVGAALLVLAGAELLAGAAFDAGVAMGLLAGSVLVAGAALAGALAGAAVSDFALFLLFPVLVDVVAVVSAAGAAAPVSLLADFFLLF